MPAHLISHEGQLLSYRIREPTLSGNAPHLCTLFARIWCDSFQSFLNKTQHSITYVVHEERAAVASLVWALSDRNAWRYESPFVAQEERPTSVRLAFLSKLE